jgi:hypothetical protein
MINNSCWILTNIYAPCMDPGKAEFIHWFKHISMPDTIDWIIVGDFNLYRNPCDRNREGDNYPAMLMFNDAISSLGLIELPLKGQRFTWSNKQHPPLLERLDWFFTSASWTLSYPNTSVSTLTMETSDHVPCHISISTAIPKGIYFVLKITGSIMRTSIPKFNRVGLLTSIILMRLKILLQDLRTYEVFLNLGNKPFLT